MFALNILTSVVKLLLTTRSKRPTGTGFIAIGGDSIEDYDAMERALKNHGYPSPEGSGLALGGGGYSQIGRVLIGGQGEGGGAQGEDTHLISGMGAGGSMASFGLLLIDWDWLRVYPLIALGGRGTAIGVRPKNNTTRGISFGIGGAQVIAGVGIELRLPLSKGFKPMIGAQVGWVWNPGGAWQGNLSLDASEMGERKASAPYVRLIAGAGLGG